MHWAAANNQTNAIARLKAEGADLNAKDKDGRTPLSRANEFDDQEAVKMLRSLGGL